MGPGVSVGGPWISWMISMVHILWTGGASMGFTLLRILLWEEWEKKPEISQMPKIRPCREDPCLYPLK
jgi:hypothetical protein